MTEGETRVAGGRTRIQAADRLIDILEFLAANDGGRASLGQISQALEVSPSTTHHLLATMRARRLVAQDVHSRLYGLGERLIELGHVALRSIDLATLVRPSVLSLRASTGQYSAFVIFRGCHRTILVREQVEERVVRPGSPLQQGAAPQSTEHATASGKLLLAYLADDELQQFLRATPLYRYTDRTITSRQALAVELETIRKQELSIDAGECDPRLGCVSAPVRDASLRVFGCLDVIHAFEDRLDTDALAETLRAHAARLSGRLQALGYRHS